MLRIPWHHPLFCGTPPDSLATTARLCTRIPDHPSLGTWPRRISFAVLSAVLAVNPLGSVLAHSSMHVATVLYFVRDGALLAARDVPGRLRQHIRTLDNPYFNSLIVNCDPCPLGGHSTDTDPP